MSTTYILLKDLPDSKAGDRYVWDDSQAAYYKNGDLTESYWLKESVEDNPEWFKVEFDLCWEMDKLTKKYKEMTDHLRKCKYTEEDMRRCFEMSKSVDFTSGLNYASYQYKNFEDYLKTLNK